MLPNNFLDSLMTKKDTLGGFRTAFTVFCILQSFPRGVVPRGFGFVMYIYFKIKGFQHDFHFFSS